MPPRLKLVALALADMADDDGRCWPGVATLCRKTGQSERTVQSALAELEAGGSLRRDERPGRSSVYHITPADFAPPQDSHPTPAESAPQPPQPSHPTPADFAPRIIKETSKEPSRDTTTVDAARRPPKKVNGHKIEFDFDKGAFKGITEADELRWQEAYPAVPIPPEIAKAAAWLHANPANRKKNNERFLVNWFARSQDRAGRVRR